MSIGAILQIAGYGLSQMIVGRVVAGIGNGIKTATALMWQGETSQAKWRGGLVVIKLIMCIAGYSLSTLITFAFFFLSRPITWRFPHTFQFVFISIIIETVSWLPESPRWLIAHQFPNEARVILADIEDLDINDR